MQQDGLAVDALPSAPRDRARVLALPVLLAVIALLGIYRSIAVDQPSWQGASFGMFATYDNISSRTVRVMVDAGGRRYSASLPPRFDDDIARLEVVPTDQAAASLAEAALRLVESEGAATVTVDVRRITLDEAGSRLALGLEPIATGSASR